MKKWLQIIPPSLYMTVILMVIFSCFTNDYFTPENFSVILRQAAPLLVISCGQTVIILTQGTDLSLGAIVSLICVLWIYLLNMGLSMPATLLLCLTAAACCGLINGLLTSKVHIPVFVTTLGTQNIFKSMALLLCGSMTIYYSHPIFRFIAKGQFLIFSWSTWIALLVFALTVVLINCTPFGMRIRALGGNIEALTVSGASVDRNRIIAFIYAGVMAGIGGLLICCRIESGNPNAGNGLEFNSVAASLLGGISLREGRGNPLGIFFGVLLIQVLKSGLMQVGISSIYQNALIGTVVLLAIIFDQVLKKMT